MLTLRAATDNDWPAVLAAANASAPARSAENESWLTNRRNFPARERQRWHYVVQDGATVIGYGAVEETGELEFRVFVVMRDDALSVAGLMLLDKLMNDLRDMGVRRAWVREDAEDAALVDFFRTNGFEDERSDRLGERSIVLLSRDLSP